MKFVKLIILCGQASRFEPVATLRFRIVKRSGNQ